MRLVKLDESDAQIVTSMNPGWKNIKKEIFLSFFLVFFLDSLVISWVLLCFVLRARMYIQCRSG